MNQLFHTYKFFLETLNYYPDAQGVQPIKKPEPKDNGSIFRHTLSLGRVWEECTKHFLSSIGGTQIYDNDGKEFDIKFTLFRKSYLMECKQFTGSSRDSKLTRVIVGTQTGNGPLKMKGFFTALVDPGISCSLSLSLNGRMYFVDRREFVRYLNRLRKEGRMYREREYKQYRPETTYIVCIDVDVDDMETKLKNYYVRWN